MVCNQYIGPLTMTDRLLPRHRQRCSASALFQSITLLAVAAFICRHVPSHAYTSKRSSVPRNSISSTCPSSIASTPGNNDNKDLSASSKHHQAKKLGRRGFLERGAAVALTSGAVVFATTTESASWAATATSIPPLGSPAPDFALINTHGQLVTLESLTSFNNPKWTILYFYPGAFTSGCTLEARKFQEILPLFTKANAQVVGVSVDPVEKNSAFCTSEGLDFFMLTDEVSEIRKSSPLSRYCVHRSHLHSHAISISPKGRDRIQSIWYLTLYTRIWNIFQSTNIYHRSSEDCSLGICRCGRSYTETSQ